MGEMAAVVERYEVKQVVEGVVPGGGAEVGGMLVGDR